MANLKKRIEYRLKHSRVLQFFYKFFFSTLIRFCGLFVRIDKKRVLFTGLGGGFNDSPKAIYLAMINDPKFNGFKLIWGLKNPNDPRIPLKSQVKIDTFKYIVVALKSKYWVACVNIERNLNFKKRGTIYLNTWHGTPLNTIGNAAKGRSDFDFSRINYFCSASPYESDLYVRDLKVSKTAILLSGLPRNDALYQTSALQIAAIKKKLNLPLDKKIILYAPTWRDSENKGKSYVLKPPMTTARWKKELSEDYIVLVRAHANTSRLLNIDFDYSFIFDFSAYPDINDLLMISDILISDYSSTIVDFSILERPIICFAYDYETYAVKRGLYFDLNLTVPGGIAKDENDVLDRIKKIDFEKESEKTCAFKKRFLQYGGNATSECINKLFYLEKEPQNI